jgi:hypothetical protein
MQKQMVARLSVNQPCAPFSLKAQGAIGQHRPAAAEVYGAASQPLRVLDKRMVQGDLNAQRGDTVIPVCRAEGQ